MFDLNVITMGDKKILTEKSNTVPRDGGEEKFRDGSRMSFGIQYAIYLVALFDKLFIHVHRQKENSLCKYIYRRRKAKYIPID